MTYTDVKAVIWDLDGDIALLPVACDTCGALVVDQRRHDEFHEPPSLRQVLEWIRERLPKRRERDQP